MTHLGKLCVVELPAAVPVVGREEDVGPVPAIELGDGSSELLPRERATAVPVETLEYALQREGGSAGVSDVARRGGDVA